MNTPADRWGRDDLRSSDVAGEPRAGFACQEPRGSVTALMVRVRFFKVRPEKLDRLQAWMAELAQRDEEVQETFRQETVRHELAYLIEGPEGPILV